MNGEKDRMVKSGNALPYKNLLWWYSISIRWQ